MASLGWVTTYKAQGQDLNEFPNLRAWYERLMARPAVQRGLEVGKDRRRSDLATDKEAQKIMFGQTARKRAAV